MGWVSVAVTYALYFGVPLGFVLMAVHIYTIKKMISHVRERHLVAWSAKVGPAALLILGANIWNAPQIVCYLYSDEDFGDAALSKLKASALHWFKVSFSYIALLVFVLWTLSMLEVGVRVETMQNDLNALVRAGAIAAALAIPLSAISCMTAVMYSGSLFDRIRGLNEKFYEGIGAPEPFDLVYPRKFWSIMCFLMSKDSLKDPETAALKEKTKVWIFVSMLGAASSIVVLYSAVIVLMGGRMAGWLG